MILTGKPHIETEDISQNEKQERLRQLEQVGKSLRENFRPGDEKGLLYKNESRDGMTDEEIDYFNLCMNDLSLGDNGRGLEILSNVKQYIEAKGYEYDTRNEFTAEPYTDPDDDYPAESFFYTKGNEALALTAVGCEYSTRYSDFRIEKCPIDELNRMKANPPKTESIRKIPSRTSEPAYPIDSHIDDKNIYGYWYDDDTNKPWWEIGNDMQKILSNAEFSSSISPSAKELFSSLGYECSVNSTGRSINYVKEEPSHTAYSIAAMRVFSFYPYSKEANLHFIIRNGTSISSSELKAVAQQFEYMEGNASKHKQEKSAEEMFADLDFVPNETADSVSPEFIKTLPSKWYGTPKDHIVFDSQSKEIAFIRDYQEGFLDVTLNVNELEAISKQVEELGWDKSKSESKTNDGLSSEFQSKDDFDIDI